MIKYKITDLLEDDEVTVITQCCNLFQIWGSGIVIPIKKKYPEAYQADLETINGDKSKLGSYSWAQGKDSKIICNLYGMKGLGIQERQLDYEAFYSCLEKLKNDFEKTNHVIGFPYKIGADRAGGNWAIIEKMIEVVFGDTDLNVIICVLPQFKHEINWVNVNC